MALTDNIIAYWKLDEASGNRADSSGNAVTLNDTNTVGSGTGALNTAAQFDGADYLTTSGNHQLANSDYTMTCWVRMATLDNTGYIMGTSDGTNYFALQFLESTDKLRMIVGAGGATGQTSNTLSAGTWHFVAVRRTHATNTVKITLDTTTTTDVGGTAGSTFTSKFSIGRAGDLASSLHESGARVDEAGLWGRALSDDEITTLYNSGTPYDIYPAASGGTARCLLGAG